MTKTNKGYIVLALTLVLMLTGVLSVWAAEVIVDSFANETTTASYTVPASVMFPVTVGAASSSGLGEVLGGQRDVCIQVDAGNENDTAQLRSDSANDYLSMALDPSIKAIGYVQWDGSTNTDCTLDTTGLPSGTDLTDSGSNGGIIVRVINSDGLRVDVTVRIYTDGSNWGSRTVAFETQVTAGDVVDLYLPFSTFTDQAGTMDETDVGAIELELDGSTNSTSADIQVKLVKATASYEYGDLPMTYGASILNARHIPLGIRLGYNVDSETDHHASGFADGDDLDQFDDEDGVAPGTHSPGARIRPAAWSYGTEAAAIPSMAKILATSMAGSTGTGMATLATPTRTSLQDVYKDADGNTISVL